MTEKERKHQLVLDMVMAGKSNAEIQEVSGYGRSTISNIMNEHGLQRKDIKHEKVIEMYRNGAKSKEICATVGYTRSNVERIIKMNTVTETRDVPATKEEILELYKELKNYKKVAKQLKANYKTVYDTIRQAGLMNGQQREVIRNNIETEEDIAIKKLIPEKKPLVFQRIKENGKVYVDVSALYGI